MRLARVLKYLQAFPEKSVPFCQLWMTWMGAWSLGSNEPSSSLVGE